MSIPDSKTLTLEAKRDLLNRPLQGSVKRLADTPRYKTQQEVNTDFRLNQIVTMLHEIKSEIADMRDMVLCSHKKEED
jgi:hypothetical protein